MTIDWSKAPEGYNWHAFDYDGRGYFYKDKPELNSFNRWNDKEGTSLMSCMVTMPSYQASLANRPQPTPRLKPTSVTARLVPPTDETRQAGSFDMPLRDDFKEMVKQTDTEEILAERGARYGRFSALAVIDQQLKDVLHNAPNWDELKPHHRVALEMITHKMSRILNGDPEYIDSWDDIGGYAKLGSEPHQ